MFGMMLAFFVCSIIFNLFEGFGMMLLFSYIFKLSGMMQTFLSFPFVIFFEMFGITVKSNIYHFFNVFKMFGMMLPS